MDIGCLGLHSILLRCHHEAEMTVVTATDVTVDRLCIAAEIKKELIEIFKGRFTNDWGKVVGLR